MNYWFKRRRFGYGWVPVTWQGWLVVVGYIVFVVGGSFSLANVSEDTVTKEVKLFFLFVALATAGLLRITYAKGPHPKWRWGKKPTDNPNEDW